MVDDPCFVGELEGIPVLHTGVFLDEEDIRSLDMNWPDRATGWLTGRATTPLERISELACAYGLPGRDDGARWALSTPECELIYAWPGKERTPTVSATFTDGTEVTIHDADLVAAQVGTRGVESRR